MLLTQTLSIRIMKCANTTCARCGVTLMVKFAALLKRFFPIAMILELLQSVSELIPSVQVTKIHYENIPMHYTEIFRCCKNE